MSLIKQRTPRPLKRDAEGYRDDRLFIVDCDDRYAPKQYFDFFRLTRIQIHVSPSEEASSAERVLERLKQIDHQPGDERWMLLDTDHFTQGTHLKGTLRAMNQAKMDGINIAFSKPCFELWLLLHHVTETSAVAGRPDARAVEAALRKVLGEYNKASLKPAHFPAKRLIEAYHGARTLDESGTGGEIPQSNTSRVYLLWKSILSKCAPNQFPAELRDIQL
jgi:hypothetical protein